MGDPHSVYWGAKMGVMAGAMMGDDDGRDDGRDGGRDGGRDDGRDGLKAISSEPTTTSKTGSGSPTLFDASNGLDDDDEQDGEDNPSQQLPKPTKLGR